MSERCERTSERTSEWPSALGVYSLISPWDGREDVRTNERTGREVERGAGKGEKNVDAGRKHFGWWLQ